MRPKVVFALFVVAAAVQVATAVGQIWKHEGVLRNGTPYKFVTAPVDPYDAFRGRYVALNYADTSTVARQGDEIEFGAPAYVALRSNADGFAEFGELSSAPPAEGDYVRVEFQGNDGTRANFRLPFDRYFMEETQAPKAEQAYLQNVNLRGQTSDLTYALVRIKDGRGVIEDIYVKGKPIREFIAAMPKSHSSQ